VGWEFRNQLKVEKKKNLVTTTSVKIAEPSTILSSAGEMSSTSAGSDYKKVSS